MNKTFYLNLKAELEVSNLQRNIQFIEENLEKTEDRLIQSNRKLNEASQAADESERYFEMINEIIFLFKQKYI